MANKLLRFLKKFKLDIIYNVILCFVIFLVIMIITKNGQYVLGSEMDFKTQHYLIPDYLRKLFYSTYNLFPSFAFNLGAGENIYNLSYYGLFNPIVMFSYLLPMVKMVDYISCAMIIVVLSSVILFYWYLKKHEYPSYICFLSSYMFLCASPIIFHMHRHIMFVSYMPFLVMGFYGIDRYIQKKQSDLLIISVALMIFTSYYFSIPGMIVLFLLGLYRFINNSKKKIDFKLLIVFGFKIIMRFLIAILVSSILIVPTLYVLLNSRGINDQAINILELIKPQIYILHDHYSMGLTYISLVALIYMMVHGKIANKLLSIVIFLLSIFPIFVFILNGFLYVNPKVLIPFIPLVLIIVSEFLYSIFNHKIIRVIIIMYIIVSSFYVCLYHSLKDKLILRQDIKNQEIYDIKDIYQNDNLYRVNDTSLGIEYINKVDNINELKTTIYSSSSNSHYEKSYNSFFHNPLLYRNKFIMASSNNLLFQMFMSEKYVITKDQYDIVYKKINNDDSLNIYKNDYVLPIGYATDQVINQYEFNKMKYPENIINLLGRIVLDSETNVNIRHDDKNIKYNIEEIENIIYEKKKRGYDIKANNNSLLTLLSDRNMNNKLLFISFDVLNNESTSKTDVAISINGITNKLTQSTWKYNNHNNNFNYIIMDGNKLNVSFTKAKYNIRNIRMSIIDLDMIKNINKNIDPLIIDYKKTKGDYIVGKINVRKNSYFALSIPYDDGFSIFVDGKKIKYFKANNEFIGFKIKKGTHDIMIKYKAPYRDLGMILSVVGLLASISMFFIEKRKK